MEFLTGNKGSMNIDFGIGVTWDVTFEDHGDDFYMVTFEQYENNQGRTICTEQLLDIDDLKGLVSLIEKVIK